MLRFAMTRWDNFDSYTWTLVVYKLPGSFTTDPFLVNGGGSTVCPLGLGVLYYYQFIVKLKFIDDLDFIDKK